MFYGYSGPEERPDDPPKNNLPRFSVRLLLFFGLTSLFWYHVHLYYQAVLTFCTLEIGTLVTQLPLGQAGLDARGNLFIQVGTAMVGPFNPWSGYAAMTSVCLVLSTSRLSPRVRIRMTVIAFFVLFLFEISGLLAHLHSCVHAGVANVDTWNREGASYPTVSADSPFHQLEYYLQRLVKNLVVVGAWVALTGHAKRRLRNRSLLEKLV